MIDDISNAKRKISKKLWAACEDASTRLERGEKVEYRRAESTPRMLLFRNEKIIPFLETKSGKRAMHTRRMKKGKPQERQVLSIQEDDDMDKADKNSQDILNDTQNSTIERPPKTGTGSDSDLEGREEMACELSFVCFAD